MKRIFDAKFEEKKKIFFITINPKPDTDHDEFMAKIHRYFGKFEGLNCTYAFEVRNYDDFLKVYTGIHCHIIIDPRRIKYDKS